jgi:hypothetical protein
MNSEQAREMVAAFEATGKFSRIEVEQDGGEFASPDAPWSIWLWRVNAKAGNQNCHHVETYDPASVASIVAVAVGKAKKRDLGALARIQANKEMDE